MKEKLLSIKINRSVEDVFEFTVNPDNTHLWIHLVKKEWINSEDIEIGTIYKSTGFNSNNENSYELTQLEKNKLFKLKSLNLKLHVTYFYTKINDANMLFNYFIETEEGYDLLNLFENEILEKLKNILEK